MLIRFLFVVACLLLLPNPSLAQRSGPLLAVDTSSPQATIRTFYELTEALEKQRRRRLTRPRSLTWPPKLSAFSI
jgi:hypothetical protein